MRSNLEISIRVLEKRIAGARSENKKIRDFYLQKKKVNIQEEEKILEQLKKKHGSIEKTEGET